MVLDAYGRKIRMLTMIDEFSWVCLVVHCAQRIGADEVIEQLANAMVVHGIPEHIRSDNNPEFVAIRLRDWLQHVGVKLLILNQAALGRRVTAKALTERS